MYILQVFSSRQNVYYSVWVYCGKVSSFFSVENLACLKTLSCIDLLECIVVDRQGWTLKLLFSLKLVCGRVVGYLDQDTAAPVSRVKDMDFSVNWFSKYRPMGFVWVSI